MKKGKKILFYIVLVILIGVFAYAAYHLGSYFWEKHKSDQMLNEANKFVTTDPDNGQQGSGNTPTGDPERITVDFAALSELNDDIVAWIYCANTKINYPVVQAADNATYLHAGLDGKYLRSGTIFADYRNDSIGKDKQFILYGHSMKNKTMFGSLMGYKKQAYYDEHPVLYYLTQDAEYRIELFAGCVMKVSQIIYQPNPDSADYDAYLEQMRKKSTFRSEVSVSAEDTVVVLSTCSYEFDNARYVALGKLVKIEK